MSVEYLDSLYAERGTPDFCQFVPKVPLPRGPTAVLVLARHALRPRDRSGQLRGPDVDPLDVGRAGEQVLGLGHQNLGDLAVQVSISAGVVEEDVEDPVPRAAEVNGEPQGGLRLLVDQRQARVEEVLNVSFAAGPGLDRDEKSYRRSACHEILPLLSPWQPVARP